MWVDTCWPVHSSIAILIVLSFAPRSAASATAPPPIIAASTAATLHRSLLRRMVSASDDCLVFAVLLPCRSRCLEPTRRLPSRTGGSFGALIKDRRALQIKPKLALPPRLRQAGARRPTAHSTAWASGKIPLPRRDMAQLRHAHRAGRTASARPDFLTAP